MTVVISIMIVLKAGFDFFREKESAYRRSL
jgi:hypothetical protein